MKHISLIEPPSKEAIKTFAEKRNLAEYLSDSYEHPQEDYLLTSEELPIFTVADGVTLNFKKLVEEKQKYPNPSPAGDVAKIFCEAVQRDAHDRYEHIKKTDIAAIFRSANDAVSKYNQKIGKSDISGNITGFYSATGSFVIIKDNKAYWASICDAYFAHFDKNMNLKFMSSGLCSPYAVINGEENMADHIEQGVIDLETCDRVFVFTDGFEHYFKNSEFLAIFKDSVDSVEDRIRLFSERMNLDDPEKYGHERSLIAIEI